jgi:cell division septal protein FtsQ
LEAQEAVEASQKDAEEAVRLSALPVDPAGGTALALWQDGAGRWWQVNGKAELRPCEGPAAKESLGLPELRGVSAAAQEHGQGKRLALRLPAGLLKTLLPLEPSVASEVRAVLLDDPAQPALLTHDGTRCLLDLGDWERRQRRLGLVLADLAAKKRRASLIDLRYEDTAVVRPAGRG